MDAFRGIIIGRLTRDPQPERRALRLSVLVRYQWPAGSKRSKSEALTVYLRGELASICENYLKKNARFYCEAHFEKGRLIADEIILLSEAKLRPLDAMQQSSKVKA